MTIHVRADLYQTSRYLTAVKASGELIRQASVVNEERVLRNRLRPLSRDKPGQLTSLKCTCGAQTVLRRREQHLT